MTKELLEQLIKVLRVEKPGMSDQDCINILGYLIENKRPEGFKCCVMSQQYNISFQRLYSFSRNYMG